MKNNLFRRILAIVLVITMFTGQLMVGQAYAEDGGSLIISDSEDNIYEQPTEPQPTDPVPTETEEYVEPEGDQKGNPALNDPEFLPADPGPGAMDTSYPLMLADGEDDAQNAKKAGDNDGLSILVTSSQTDVKDGDTYTFSVTIADDDLDTEPNITPGDKLTIELPEFLTSSDMDAALRNCFAYFERDYVYNEENHTLVLTVKDSQSGTWANIKFDVTMTVDTIGYDGEGDGSIDVGLGDVTGGTTKGEASTDLDVDVGLGNGTGTGSGSGDGDGDGDDDGDNSQSPTEEQYLQKNIWSNYTLSEYGISTESYVMRDPDAPIGYAVAFGVNRNYSGYATLEDDLSNGNLTLCDKDGNTNVELSQCFQVFVDGVQQTRPTYDTDTVTYYSNLFGTITIERNGSGFILTCHNESADPNATGVIDVIVRYYAAVTGENNDITNTVTLTINESVFDTDSTTIRQYDSQGLTVTKSIVDGGNTYHVIDIDENTKEITFRLTLTQYGTGSYYKKDQRFTYDTLADCFTYVDTVENTSQFRLEKEPGNDQQINIIKNDDEDIQTGVYHIDFKVTVDQSKLGFGEQTTNTLGNTVYIRRMAKLTINKEWAGTDVNKGEGAKFGLYNGDTLVAETEMSNSDSFELYLTADKLANGTHTYTLKEEVDINSDYVAAQPIDVVITKENNEITIDSIGGKSVDSGHGSVSVVNEQDSGMGTLKFKKYGGSVNENNLLDGGQYELYRVVEDAADVKVAEFTTDRGVKEFTDLEYGTYYIKEISAPSGYVIQVEGNQTDPVELKKATPNQELHLVNKLYTEGEITVTKVDENGNALSGASFGLFTDAEASKQYKEPTVRDNVYTFDHLPAGTYYLKETSFPYGYSGYTGVITVVINEKDEAITNHTPAAGVTISEDSTTSDVNITWKNEECHGSITIIKTDEATGAPLSGVEFELYSASDSNFTTPFEPTTTATNADGILVFNNLPYGNYKLFETTPYPGYDVPANLQVGGAGYDIFIGIDSSGKRIESVTCRITNDTTKGSIKIKKADSDTGAALAGACFTLTGSAIEPVIKYTNSDGICSFENLEAGIYTLEETFAPDGYQKDSNDTYTFYVGMAKDGAETVVWDWNLTDDPITNSKQVYTVKVIKNDENNKPLAGAVFKLTGKDIWGNDVVSESSESGADGVAEFKNVNFGTYTIEEITAPTGYALSTQKLSVVIDKENQNSEHVVNAGVIQNNPFVLEVIKIKQGTAGGNEVYLAGTEFVIRSGDKYVTATYDQERAVYTYTGTTPDKTDPNALFVTAGTNGSFKIEKIPAGDYVLEEIKATDGYIITESETEVHIVAGTNINYRKTIGNTQIQANLNLIKTDELSNLLPGVVFTMKTNGQYVKFTQENGAYIYDGIFEGEYSESNTALRLTTGTDGTLVVKGLLMGVYTLDEVSGTPDGLEPASGITFEVVADTPSGGAGIKYSVKHGSTLNLPVVNNLKVGSIEFTKVDSANEPLPGATFKIELIEETGSMYSDGYTAYAVSGSDGKVVFKNVPYGVYAISEYLAPYGKELSETVYYANVGDAAVEPKKVEGMVELTQNLQWVNEDKQIDVTFKKVSTDGTGLSGAMFRILDSQGNIVKFLQNGELVDTLVISDAENGNCIQLPIGQYQLVEVQAPADYILDKTPVPFTVTVEGPNEVVRENKPFTGSLTIIKQAKQIDGNDEVMLLPGAEFKVYTRDDYYACIANGFTVYDNGEPVEAVYTVSTNSDGRVTIENIPCGEYVVVETKAPEGYELSKLPQDFSIRIPDDSDELNVERTFTNEKSRYVFKIAKIDIRDVDESGELTDDVRYLPGAKFAVTGENGFYTEVETDENGIAIVYVPEPGTYHVQEIGAPDGYTIDPGDESENYMVTVEGHTPVDVEIPVGHVSKDYPTRVNLSKVNEDGALLEGAVFELYRITGTSEELVYLTETENAYVYDPDSKQSQFTAGEITIEQLPVGGYILREVSSPEKYMALGDTFFTVYDDRYDEALELRVENIPYARGVAIHKQSPDGKMLAGAEFTLYKEDGSFYRAVETDAFGFAVFTDLGSGSYYIKESQPPEGYQSQEEKYYSFTIDGEGKLQSEDDFEFVGTDETPFYVLTVTNQPVEQQLRIKKVSANSTAEDEILLEGAKFRILGNGVNEEYTTGSDGLTEVISLSVGEYMLTETKAPNGYIINGTSHHLVVKPDGIELDGESLTGEIPVYTVTNVPQNFRMAIHKRDEATLVPLAGAAFTITAEDGSKYYLVTDEAGETDPITLKPGKYAVSETVAPVGYNVPLAGWDFTVDEGSLLISSISGSADYTFENGLLTLTLTNKRTTGSLMIYKYDADDNLPLAGAKFMVVNDDGKAVWFTVKNGVYHVADANAEGAGNMLSTNAMGQALLDGLIFGNYTVNEVVAPEGYKLLADGVKVKLTEQDETLELKLANEKLLRKVTVIKQSAGENPENLIGAVFTLYSIDAAGNRTYVSEATTLYNGKAEFTVPFGDYVIVETRAPAGYELSNTEPWFFSYNAETEEDAEFTYTFVNEKTVYSLEVYKYDADHPRKGLAGAEFAITDSRGYTKVVTTGSDGIARLEDVTYDDYTIREITAPEGYYLNDEVFTVRREELKHGVAVRVEVPNTYIIGSVTLKKVDSENTDLILDAQFTVSDSEGNLLKWKKTDDGYVLSDKGDKVIHAGEVMLSGLPAGDYTITEIKAPDGYLILDENRSFTINADNALAGMEIEIENLQRKLAVGITKVDAADPNIRLEGAEFTLYTKVNGAVGEAVMTVTTDKNGLAVFADITMGNYRLVETKAPYGFKLWENPIDFTIDADGNVRYGKNQTDIPERNKVHMFSMSNESILQDLTILKTDADNGEALAGAVFTVSGEEGSWRVTTGDDGTAVLSLPYGEYILEELIAPDGYILDNSKHLIVVSKDGITVNGAAVVEMTYVIENTSIAYPVALHKQDASNGKSLSGAEFTISGNDVSYKLKTNATGNSDTVYLTPGKYTISETKAPKDYKQPLDGWTLTVSKDGRVSVEGEKAVVAVNAGSITVTIENVEKTSASSSGIAKTGQSEDNMMLLSGAALMLFSFAGLLYLMLDENKRRRAHRVI